MTTTENNVAAQSGDEPMDYAEQLRAAVETVCEGWTLPPGARKTLEAALWAPQVSPRATADVERDKAIKSALVFGLKARGYLKAGTDAYKYGIELREMIEMFDFSAIATTKPGA